VKKLRTGKEPFDRVVFHSSKMPSGPASYNLLANVITETLWYTDVNEWGSMCDIRIDDLDCDENRLMTPIPNPGE